MSVVFSVSIETYLDVDKAGHKSLEYLVSVREKWSCGHTRLTRKMLGPSEELKLTERKCPTCMKKKSLAEGKKSK